MQTVGEHGCNLLLSGNANGWLKPCNYALTSRFLMGKVALAKLSNLRTWGSTILAKQNQVFWPKY